VVALGRLIGPGSLGKTWKAMDDWQAIATMGEHLADVHIRVQETVVDSLSQEMFIGNDLIIIAALSQVNSADYHVRRSSATLLARIALKGDTRAVDAFNVLSDDKYPDIRLLAANALNEIAPQNELTTLDAMSERRIDTDLNVRSACIKVLMNLGNYNNEWGEVCRDKQDQRTIIALSAFAGDDNPNIRLEALQAVGFIAGEDNFDAIAVLTERIYDSDLIWLERIPKVPDFTVCRVCAEALLKIDPNGDIAAAVIKGDLLQVVLMTNTAKQEKEDLRLSTAERIAAEESGQL